MAGMIVGYNAPRRNPQLETGMSQKGGTPEPIYGPTNPEQDAYDRLFGGGGSGDVVSGGIPSSIMALNPTVSAPGYARGGIGGDASVSQGAFDRQQEIQLAHDLEMQRLDKKNQSVQQLLSRYGDSGASSRVQRTPEDAAKEQAARDAAFARAKEKAGQTARASMASLNDMVAGAGMTGGSVHAMERGRVLGGAEGEIGEFLRDQAISEADRASEISDMEYQGQIAQRGQEMAKRQAILSLISNMSY